MIADTLTSDRRLKFEPDSFPIEVDADYYGN